LGRDHHLVVAGKEAIEVAGSHSSKVKGDVIQEFGSNQTLQVTQVLYVKGMQLILEAATAVCLKVGGNFITIDPSGVAIKGTIVQINSGGAALSGSSASCVPPLSPTAARDAIQAQAGAMAASAAAGTITPASLSLAKLSAASNAPTHNAKAPENEEKKSWIEIELFDDEKAPVAGEPYRVTLADGTTVADGTLDEQGFARVDHIDPGTCKVTFPNLDKEMWDRKPAEEKQSKTAGEEI
jgi:type VI secretion system secreted protein VgrG